MILLLTGIQWVFCKMFTKAHRILINLLFVKKKALRIQAILSVKNAIELKILRKCDFKLEGILRKAGRVGNNIHNLAIPSILREDLKKY